MPDVDNSRITYTVKEMFARVDSQLKELDMKLDRMLDVIATHVTEVQLDLAKQDIDHNEKRIGELESEVKTFKRIIALIGSLLTAAVVIIQARGGF